MLEQVVYPDRQKMIGERFKIVHLESEKGKGLNGRYCTVVGFDRDKIARLHCRIEGDNEEAVKLKNRNLVAEETNAALENFMENSAPMPDNKIAACLELALEKHSGPMDRADLIHRVGLYRDLLQKLQSSESSLTDEDYCFPCADGLELLNEGGDNTFGVLMNAMIVGCCGNGTMDMRYVDRGLKGDNHTECSVCHEVLAADSDGSLDQVLVTLPCLHVFHEKCIVDWLDSDVGRRNWNCPTCRQVVPDDMSTYRVHYDEQVQRRVDEYPLSGYCTKCMMWLMERIRNEELPITFE